MIAAVMALALAAAGLATHQANAQESRRRACGDT